MKNLSLLLLFAAIFSSTAKADLVVYDDTTDSASAFTIVKDANGIEQLTVLNCPSMQTIDHLSQCTNPMTVFPLTELKAFVGSTVVGWAKTNTSDLKPMGAKDIQQYYQAYLAKTDKTYQDKVTKLAELHAYLGKVKSMRQALPNSDAYKQKELETNQSIDALSVDIQAGIEATKASVKIESVINDLADGISRFLRVNKARDETKPVSASNPATDSPNSYAKSQMAGTLMNAVMSRITDFSTKGKIIYTGGEIQAVKISLSTSPGAYNAVAKVIDSSGEHELGARYGFIYDLTASYKDQFVLVTYRDDYAEIYCYPSGNGTLLRAKRFVSLESIEFNGATATLQAKRKDGTLYQTTADMDNLGVKSYDDYKWEEVPVTPAPAPTTTN